MISFAKHIAVAAAALVATTALAEKADDSQASTPDPKVDGAKKPKKNKKKSEDPNATPAPRKAMDVPVEKGHDSIGLHIPYFNATGKREMNFTIGVASRIDDNHIRMKDTSVETFNEEGEHEMQIDLPTSVMDTEKSMIATDQHVTIRRSDFVLTGDAMIFYTRTKQGGLGGNVHMTIFNLKDETGDDGKPDEEKSAAKKSKPLTPDTFKTPQARSGDGAPLSKDKADKFYTPGPK